MLLQSKRLSLFRIGRSQKLSPFYVWTQITQIRYSLFRCLKSSKMVLNLISIYLSVIIVTFVIFKMSSLRLMTYIALCQYLIMILNGVFTMGTVRCPMRLGYLNCVLLLVRLRNCYSSEAYLLILSSFLFFHVFIIIKFLNFFWLKTISIFEFRWDFFVKWRWIWQ